MSAKPAHSRRSASLLLSVLIVSLLSLGACTRSYTEPEDPGSDYAADARAGMRAATFARPRATRREGMINPRAEALKSASKSGGDRPTESISFSYSKVSF